MKSSPKVIADVGTPRLVCVAWAAFVVALLCLLAASAEVCWVAQPLALFVLPIPFAAILILLVVVRDRHDAL